MPIGLDEYIELIRKEFSQSTYYHYLPSGGTWAYFLALVSSSGSSYFTGVAAGGALVATSLQVSAAVMNGFIWRVA